MANVAAVSSDMASLSDEALTSKHSGKKVYTRTDRQPHWHGFTSICGSTNNLKPEECVYKTHSSGFKLLVELRLAYLILGGKAAVFFPLHTQGLRSSGKS